jgi:thymidylate synthase
MLKMPIEFEPIPDNLPSVDVQYLNLLHKILVKGTESKDRTGVGTKKLFGERLKIDLQQGFPLLTTKDVWFKGVKEELLWFIQGKRDLQSLLKVGVHFWDEWPFQKYLKSIGQDEKFIVNGKFDVESEEWKSEIKIFTEKVKTDDEFAKKYGDLGEVYGYKWRHWVGSNGKEVDQLKAAINDINNNPDSRRIIVTAWDPSVLSEVALPPCHMEYQFQVTGNKLNCFMVQRSVDTFLGLPFNIASYALLTHLVARITNKVPGELTMNLADTHIYLNHKDQVEEQLSRDPRPLPKLILDSKITSLDNIYSEGIIIEGYDPHPAIKAPIAV